MTWTPADLSWVSPPYSVHPGVRGWSVYVGDDITFHRIGRDIKTLKNAQSLAELHAKGDKRVPA